MRKSAFILIYFLSLAFFFQSCNDDLFDINKPPIEEENIIESTLSKRVCSMQDHMNKLLQNPTYQRKHQNKFIALKKTLSIAGTRDNCSTPVIIPVAVHYQDVSNPQTSCLMNLAKTQIDILNEDFSGTNSDISKWKNTASNSFPGIQNAEMCVRFVLADKNHPSGYGLSNGSPAITINKTSGDFESDWSGYLNIYVQSGTGALGYAPLGGAGNGDGVVIDANAFGAGNGCGNIDPLDPFDLGRTTTHEVGHYLLLDHIWGYGCGEDDGVTDTPNSEEEYYDCPSLNQSSCGSKDLHMNYMDYTNDACMYMFTKGQENRMEAYISNSLSKITSNASKVISDYNNENEDDEEDSDNDDEDDSDEEENAVISDCDAEAVHAETGAPLTNQIVYDIVVENDSYCCDVEFDYLCQEAYDELLAEYEEEEEEVEEEEEEENDDEEDSNEEENNCPVEAIDFVTGQELEKDNCLELVQGMDSYCCEVEWDRLCQFYYDGCSTSNSSLAHFENDKAVVLMAQNELTGEIQITYSLRDISNSQELFIMEGNVVKEKIKLKDKRGSFIRKTDNWDLTIGIEIQLKDENRILKQMTLKP